MAVLKLGIAEKFALFLLAVAIASILLYSLNDSLTNDLKAHLIEDLKEKNEMRMDTVDSFMHERLTDLALISSKGSVLSDRNATIQEKREYLQNFERAAKTYVSVTVYDEQGVRIIDTRGLLVGSNESQRPFVAGALSGKTMIEAKPEISLALNTPVMRFTSPLYDKEGKIMGAVTLRMFATRVTTALGLTEDDRVEITDKDGLVLFAPYDREEELIEKSDLVSGADILIPKGQRSVSLDVKNGSRESLYVIAREQGYLEYPGYGWLIIEEVDVQTALLPVKKLKGEVALFGSLWALAVIIIFFLASRRLFIDPLGKITKAATELERGNYSVRVDLKSNDEIGSLARVFNRTVERLEKVDAERKQLDKAKTEFISISSHELRSPMTPIKGQLEMLEGGYFGKLNKKQKEAADIVLRNTERLDKIIVDMLEVSRIEAARLKFNFSKVNIASLVSQIETEMNAYLPEKKVKLQMKVGKIPEVTADPDRISQVLRNLISNAIKFSNPGGRVVITVKEIADGVEFSVQDFGRGIDEEGKKRIFEPFFQAEPAFSRTFGGTGLGLSICRGIVEAQNGKIWFDSEFGKGTTFHFTLPLKPVQNIKSINVLFSKRAEMDAKIKKEFIEHLGPLGEREFERLKKAQQLDYLHIHDYLKSLEESGILDNAAENALEFDILVILSPGKNDAKVRAAEEKETRQGKGKETVDKEESGKAQKK